ncbi:MAG: NADH-quinone oxidoreductase subunit L, partial [Verrucomicrobiota bacterium]
FGGVNEALFGPFNHNVLAALLGLFAILLGASLAWTLYGSARRDPLPGILRGWSRALRDRLYFDEVYEGVCIPLHDLVARVVSGVDQWLVSGLVLRGVSGSVELVGRALRLVQTGNLQTYTFLFTAGAVLVAWLVLR